MFVVADPSITSHNNQPFHLCMIQLPVPPQVTPPLTLLLLLLVLLSVSVASFSRAWQSSDVSFPRRPFQPHLAPRKMVVPPPPLDAAMNDNNDNDNDDDPKNVQGMVNQHKASVQANSTTHPIQNHADHVRHQATVFDDMAPYFATRQTVPPALVPVYQHLGQQIICQAQPRRILDVACGAGALFEYLLMPPAGGGSDGNPQPQVHHHITGVDVSANMVAAAQETARALLQKNNATTIDVIQSDISAYSPGAQRFDVIILNACWGNLYEPAVVLRHLCQDVLRPDGGQIIVSHPLGAPFVQRLHTEDARTVPHLLPADTQAWAALLQEHQLPLVCTQLDLQFRNEPYYMARLEREK